MGVLKRFNNYRGLPRSIYIIFLARIINSMGAFVYPFLTYFFVENLGLGEHTAGEYILLASTAFVPGSLIGGKLADHFGRKKILLLFQGLAALTLIPCAFLGNSMMIPWLLILSSFFGGAANPSSGAMVTDLTNPNNRQEAFSLLYLGTNLGIAVGPLIAGFLYNNYIEWIFLGDAITTFISLLLVLIYVKETIPSEDEVKDSFNKKDDEKAEEGNIILVLLKRPALLAFSAVSTIYSFVYSQHSFSIPLQVREIFAVNGPKVFGWVMTTNALSVIILTVFITVITRNNKSTTNIAVAGIFYSIGFGMLYYINSFYLVILSTVVWTIGEILIVTNSSVYIANHTPISHRGRFNAVLPIISGFGYAVGPVIMGKYIEANSVRMVWPILFVLSLGAATLMYLLSLTERTEVRLVKDN
ncbi:MDR family MFS transporter [Caloranaerobacter ferrireducens]|uniref:MDR family MFS transporter n=1 Tax=Caloranaerobacter ferrireducens TaxID=1323370 RepID=UPI00084D7125|nr:MFS transporter [Caloranaerobacter ferrireducens]